MQREKKSSSSIYTSPSHQASFTSCCRRVKEVHYLRGLRHRQDDKIHLYIYENFDQLVSSSNLSDVDGFVVARFSLKKGFDFSSFLSMKMLEASEPKDNVLRMTFVRHSLLYTWSDA